MNSLGEIVVLENIVIPIGPNMESGVDDPLFQSESFRTLPHTTRIFNPSYAPSIVRNIYGNLGAISDQPMASQMPKRSITYMVPLDHFTCMTSNFTTFSVGIIVACGAIIEWAIWRGRIE